MIMRSYFVHFIVLPGLNKVFFDFFSHIKFFPTHARSLVDKQKSEQLSKVINYSIDDYIFVPSPHNLHNNVSDDFETILVFAY